MSKRSSLLGVLFLSSALILTAVLIFGDQRASGQDNQNEQENSVARINAKAESLNTADERVIRDLTDEVFKSFNADLMPPEVLDSVKDRIVRAEVAYRSGYGHPVSEFGVVRMTNMLMKRLGAPAYAQTNVYEVRRLEMNFVPFLSKFIGKKPAGTSDGPKALGSSFNPKMSPLESVAIANLLIQQKRKNPAYQLTHDEWVAKNFGKSSRQHEIGDNSRSRVIEAAFQRGGDLSVGELVKLPHRALDQLGIERVDGRTGQ
jgi:hypothetical protein